MDAISPDESGKESSEERNRQAHQVLCRSRKAVLTMSTGGCARYAFSSDVAYCLDRRGYPLLRYTSANPHHHLIVTNTTMSLRILHQSDSEGNELSLLILNGKLQWVNPGDHDSLDRHFRYFGEMIENYPRGACRLYRFAAENLYFELFSGERLPLGVDAVIQRNPLSARDEIAVITAALARRRAVERAEEPLVLAGADALGLDVRAGDGGWRRWDFPVPIRHVDEALAALESATFAL